MSHQKKGGEARAASLTAEQRKEIATKAAASRWGDDIPIADYTGMLKIGSSEIPCAVFEYQGIVRRVIVQREVVGLITGNKKGGLSRYLSALNLQQFVPEKFKDKSLDQATISVKMNGRKANCFEGEDIVAICKMYINARRHERIGAKVLLPSQEHLADQAEIIMDALASVGITGLIDEATGYQYAREHDALQQYLTQVLNDKLAAWVKRFPNEFFEQMCRLKNWEYKGPGKVLPSVAGKYVTNIVYERLGPNILDELERLNPKNKNGNRQSKHHQWLTDDVGHPMLSQHLYAMTNTMKGFDNWDLFLLFIDKAFPKHKNFQLSLI